MSEGIGVAQARNLIELGMSLLGEERTIFSRGNSSWCDRSRYGSCRTLSARTSFHYLWTIQVNNTQTANPDIIYVSSYAKEPRLWDSKTVGLNEHTVVVGVGMLRQEHALEIAVVA